ncbi:hypothetical protein ACS0TY_024140 [Phlomoides rotata]
MQFMYIISRWEGLAADSHVLCDAINRVHGLEVPKGNYYLCDNGYPNYESFLTPYKGVRYHLNEWSARQPQNYQEYFNMKHTRVQNLIGRSFGLLKMHWGILHGLSWYDIGTANQIIMACCLIHTYIKKEMDVDPLEGCLDEYMSSQMDDDHNENIEIVESLDATNEWTAWRDMMASNMYNEWRDTVEN